MSVSLPWTQRGRRRSLTRGATQTKLSGLWQASRSKTLAENDLAFSAVSVDLPLLSTEISNSVQSSKAFVRGSLNTSTHNGIKLVSPERRKNFLATLEDGVQYAEKFEAACKRKYGNMCRAWRLLLNPGGNGRVSFVPFCNAARSMGFVNVSTSLACSCCNSFDKETYSNNIKNGANFELLSTKKDSFPLFPFPWTVKRLKRRLKRRLTSRCEALVSPGREIQWLHHLGQLGSSGISSTHGVPRDSWERKTLVVSLFFRVGKQCVFLESFFFSSGR